LGLASKWDVLPGLTGEPVASAIQQLSDGPAPPQMESQNSLPPDRLKASRWRLRFSLRALFVVLTVLCLLGWYYTRCERQRKAIAELNESECRVSFDRVDVEELLQGSTFAWPEKQYYGDAEKGWEWWKRYLWKTPEAILFSSVDGDLQLKALGQLPTVKTARFRPDWGSPDFSAAGLEHIVHHRGLIILDLGHNLRFGDNEARQLGRMSSLEALRLNASDIGDTGAKALLALPNLRVLDIAESSISDEAFTGDLSPRLEWLSIAGTAIDDGAIRSLARSHSLRELNVSETSISNEGLTALADFKNLKVLHLTCPNITDEGIRSISALNQLERLVLSLTAVTDVGLSQLTLHTLRDLDIWGTEVTDAGLVALVANCPNLKSLNLMNLDISDDGLRSISSLKLERLDLCSTDITDAGLGHLSTLPLVELDLSNTRLTDDGLEHLAGISTLRKLRVYGTNVTEDGVMAFKARNTTCAVEPS
jgi:hypothetical protein